MLIAFLFQSVDVAELIGGLTGALIFVIIAVILIVFISWYCYHFQKRRRSRRSQPAHLPPPSTTKQNTTSLANQPTVSESPDTVTWSRVTKSGNTITQVTVHVTQISSGDVNVATKVTSEQSKTNDSPGLMSTPPPPYSEKDAY